MEQSIRTGALWAVMPFGRLVEAEDIVASLPELARRAVVQDPQLPRPHGILENDGTIREESEEIASSGEEDGALSLGSASGYVGATT